MISNSKGSNSILSSSQLTRNSEARCPVRHSQTVFPLQLKSYGWLDGFSAHHYTKHEWEEKMQNFNRVWNVDAVNRLPLSYQLESRTFRSKTKCQPESTNTMPQSQNTDSEIFITNCAINGQVPVKNLTPSLKHKSKCSEGALRHRTMNLTVEQLTSEGQDNFHKATIFNYYKNQQSQNSSCRWLQDINKSTDAHKSGTTGEKYLNCNITTPLTSSFCTESTMSKRPTACFNYFKAKVSHALKFLKPHSENQVQR